MDTQANHHYFTPMQPPTEAAPETDKPDSVDYETVMHMINNTGTNKKSNKCS